MIKGRQRRSLRRHGFTLLSTLITGLIVALIALALSQMLTHGFYAAEHTRLTDELVSLRQVLRGTANCQQTLSASGATCTLGNYFPLLDTAGNIIGKPDLGTWSLGSFHYRASCNGTKMTVEAARPLSSSTFLSDPLTKAVYSWTNLFPDGALNCSSYWGTTSSCATPFCTVSRGNVMIVAGVAIHFPNPPGGTGSSGCNAGGWIALAGSPYVFGEHWTSDVHCPAGYVAVGGGMACEEVTGGGIQGESYPKNGGDSWFTDCCAYYSATAPATLPGYAFAVCLKY